MYTHLLDDKNIVSKSILTFGNFDGIHLGHKHLLDKLIELSNNNTMPSVVITFDPHTNIVLNKSKNFNFLTSFNIKSDILNAYKIDYLCKVNFNETLSRMSAQLFIDKIINKYNPKILLIGYDNYFGHNKEGSYEFIINNEKYSKIHIIKIDQYKLNNMNVKSSIIKTLIEKCNIKKANIFLNRIYTLEGYVSKGDGLSNRTGFKTANIKLLNNQQLIPGNGVYSVNLLIDQISYMSICNIGYCPTVKKTSIKSIEVHIIDENISIYNKKVSVEFVSYIRSEIKFDNTMQLHKQILNDINSVKNERMINSGR